MNPIFFRILAGAVVLAVAAGLSSPRSEAAAGRGDGVAAFSAAADALATKMNAGSVPAATDPAVAAFEAQSLIGLEKLGTAALPIDGFESYEALCGKTAVLMNSYLVVGIAPDAAPAARTAQMTSNAGRYVEQMFTPLLFSVHCTAAHMSFIESQVTDRTLAEKREALDMIRDGSFGQASGLMEFALSIDATSAQRRRIVDQLAIDMKMLAPAFSAEQRAEIAGMADLLPPRFSAQARAIKAGIQAAPCGRLCSM